jgi:transcriptional regulator with XRE-family HTH domain
MSIITASQVRAAKALLRWSGEDLAQKSGISLSTIRRVESSESVPEGQNLKTILAIRDALESAGVEFIGTPDDRPGVRLNQPSK